MDTTIHINVADIPPEVGESFGRVTLAGFKKFIAQPGNREKLEAQTAARKQKEALSAHGWDSRQYLFIQESPDAGGWVLMNKTTGHYEVFKN